MYIRYTRKSRQKGNAPQKLLGILALCISTMEFVLAHYGLIDGIDGGGAFIIMIPLGIALLFSRENTFEIEED